MGALEATAAVPSDAPERLLPPLLVSGEKLRICGVIGVHLVEFPQATSNEDVDSSDGLSPALPIFSESTTSSLNIRRLRPRRLARIPWLSLRKHDCFRLEAKASSNEPTDELGEVARVLATEPWLTLLSLCKRPSSMAPCDGADWNIVVVGLRSALGLAVQVIA
jgi:hypothetical protein